MYQFLSDEVAHLRSPRGARWTVLLCLPVLGCSLLDILGDPDLSVALAAQDTVYADVRLEVDVGGRLFVLDSAGRRQVDAPRTGDLSVTVVLLSGSDTLAVDTFMQRFEDSDVHWIHALVGGARPMGFCVGTVRARAISDTRPDSLFVLHGRIPKGAIC